MKHFYSILKRVFHRDVITSFVVVLFMIAFGTYRVKAQSACDSLQIQLSSKQDVTCFGYNNGSFVLLANGGIAPYEYALDTNFFQASNVFNNLIAGDYVVYVKDSVGCLKTDTITILQPTAFSILLYSIIDVRCYGFNNGAFKILASGGTAPYLFSLDNVVFNSDSTFSNISAGNYTVYAIDSNACVTSNTIGFYEPPILQLTVDSIKTPSCHNGNDGFIEITVSGGDAPFSYNWNNGVATQNQSNASAGIYSVTATDSRGCIISSSPITINNVPPLEVTTISNYNICAGGNILLKATANSSPLQFSWQGVNGFSGNGDSIVISNAAVVNGGNYIVTATNGICNAKDTLNVTVFARPFANAGRDTSVCLGAVLTLGNATVASGGLAPYTYNWNPLTGLNDNQLARPALVVTQSGVYTVSVTDSRGCIATDAVEITLGRCNEICLSAKGPNILGPMGSFSVPYMIPNNGTSALCIRNGLNTFSPLNNIAMPKPLQTTYVYAQSSGGLFPEGRYTFLKTVGDLTGPSCLHSRFRVVEHTGDGGYFMAINGSPNQALFGATFFRLDSIPVCANTNYEFSAFLTNMLTGIFPQPASAFPNVSFFINGVVVATSGPIANNPGQILNDWLKAGGIWNSGSAQYANIRIDNATFVASGNDLGLDDIVFSVCGPIIIDNVPNKIYCEGENFNIVHNINSTGTTNYSFYRWQRSTNNGTTWTNATGVLSERNTPVNYTATLGPITASLSINGHQYRLLVANDSLSLVNSNSFCYAVGPTTTIQVRPSPVAYAGVDKTICPNSSVIIGRTPAATGGTAPYTYLWNNASLLDTATIVQPLASPSTTTTFILTVTDTLGCSATDNMVVTVSQPNASLGLVNNITCYGAANGSIALQNIGGTAPYQFNWSNGANTQNISALDIGNYTITITDALGCTATANYPITQPNLLQAALNTQHVSCYNGSNGTANIIVSGGTLPNSYTWNDGNILANRNNLIAGNYAVTITDNNNCTTSANSTIIQPNEIIVNAAIAPIKCFNGNDGGIDLTISGGIAPYNFNWNNSVAEDLQNIPAGNYNVTITDSNGCVANRNYSLTQPDELDINFISNDVSCFGANNGNLKAIVIGGTLPYQYLWSNAASADSINNLLAGNYALTINDANNCSLANAVNIIEPALLQAQAITNNVSCYNGSNGIASVNVLGGTLPYHYAWNNGNTQPNSNTLTANNYSVTITDAQQCITQITFDILQPDAITILGITDSVSCYNGNDGSINLNVSGGTQPYFYNWNNTLSTEDITNIDAGIYFLTLTDANACTINSSYVVYQPLPLATQLLLSPVTCYNGNNGSLLASATGGTAPYNFAWSNATNNNSNSNLRSGVYTLTITDIKGCQIDTTIAITQPDSLLLQATIKNVSCYNGNDGNILLNVNGGIAPYNLQWSNGGFFNFNRNLIAGNYAVTIVDANNCTSNAVYEITQPLALQIALNGSPLICTNSYNGIIQAMGSGGTGAYYYNWNTGASTSRINNLPYGNYSLTVSDAMLCSTSATYTIGEYQYEADFNISDATICAGDNILFTQTAIADTTINNSVWAFSNNTYATTDTVLQGFNDAGNYSVTLYVTFSNGCIDTISKPFRVNALPTVSLGNDRLICPGDAVTIIASGAQSYVWQANDIYTPIANDVIRATPKDTFVVNVIGTDRNGCSNTDSVIIYTHNVSPLIISNDTLLCKGTQTTLQVSNGFNYNWGNSALVSCNTCQTVTTNIDTTHTYYVTANDANGCTLQDSVKIYIVPLPKGLASIDTAICEGTSATLSAFAETSVNYLWLPDSSSSPTIIVSPLATTTYYLQAKTTLGCSILDSVTIIVNAQPVISVTDSFAYCTGQQVSLQLDTALLYTWLPTDGLSCSNCSNPTIQADSTTEYFITIATEAGCIFNDSINVTVFPLPTVSVSQQQKICKGDIINLSASSPTAIAANWMPMIGLNNSTGFNVIAQPDSTINYKVIVVDSNGCYASDDILVTVAYKVQISMDSMLQTCQGNSLILSPTIISDGAGAITYNWLPENKFMMNHVAQQTFQPNEDGSYMVIVSSGNCIPDTQRFNIDVHENPRVTLSGPAHVIAGDSFNIKATAVGGNNFTWHYNDTTLQNNNATLTHSIISPTTYKVTLSNSDGCIDTASINVRVIARCGDDAFIPNAFTPNGDDANDKLCIRSLELTGIRIFRIFNRWGELIFETTDINHCWDGSFKGKLLNPDVFVYYAEGTCGNGQVRFIKGNVTLIR